jgi:hypothetical protein
LDVLFARFRVSSIIFVNVCHRVVKATIDEMESNYDLLTRGQHGLQKLLSSLEGLLVTLPSLLTTSKSASEQGSTVLPVIEKFKDDCVASHAMLSLAIASLDYKKQASRYKRVRHCPLHRWYKLTVCTVDPLS